MDYLPEHVIEHITAPTCSKKQNGIAEHVSRSIVELPRKFLAHAGLAMVFWAEVVVHAAKVGNHFFCSRDSLLASFEIMKGSKPEISFFRLLRCSD